MGPVSITSVARSRFTSSLVGVFRVLAPARLPDAVLLRPDTLRGLGQGDLPDRRDDPAVEEEEAIPRLGRRDDGDHRFIRSWMR